MAVKMRISTQRVAMGVEPTVARMTVEEARLVHVGGSPYEGAYEITPSQQRQVLPTQFKTMQENLVINPIPENYGLVTYDQNKTITVS